MKDDILARPPIQFVSDTQTPSSSRPRTTSASRSKKNATILISKEDFFFFFFLWGGGGFFLLENSPKKFARSRNSRGVNLVLDRNNFFSHLVILTTYHLPKLEIYRANHNQNRQKSIFCLSFPGRSQSYLSSDPRAKWGIFFGGEPP